MVDEIAANEIEADAVTSQHFGPHPRPGTGG